MTAIDLVRFLTSGLFLLIFVAVAATALRSRRRADVDAALLFGGFAFVFVESQLASSLQLQLPPFVGQILIVVLMALPYLLLRLVDDFAGVSRRVMLATLAGFALSSFVLLVRTGTSLGPLVVPIVAYFGVVEVYAAVRFVQAARRSTGVTRRRMEAAAAGSFLFGLTIVVAGTLSFVLPAASGVVTMVLALASALAYALAFAPPALIRRAWREPELRSFLDRVVAIAPAESQPTIVARLERGAAEAVGSGDARIWQAEAGGTLRAPDGTAAPADSPVAQAFERGRRSLSEDGGLAMLAAPMEVRGKRLGVLAITARRGPAFAGDALELVELLAQQAALALDGARVYTALAEANEQLSRATRAKSEFLASMSHELRTPLNAILGFGELLSDQLDGTMNDRQRRYFRNIHDAGEHLLELINDVLDLSKVEAGKTELRPEVGALSAILEPVIAATRATAGERGLAFDALVQEDALVRVDLQRMRQILYNLLSNALKFTQDGKVALTAGLEGTDLAIAVSDTGIGIPDHKRDRVFGMFERLNEDRSSAGGTGLGLALTKRLVELHGGTIEFKSEVGLGTTFHVRLPAVAVEALRGDRLLVVEDQLRDAELVVEMASREGLRSEVALSAEAAFAAVARGGVRGIVLDLRLPDERGDTVLRTLKSDPVTRGIPILVVTVEDDDGQTRSLGADDHLTKPISNERLVAWLRRVAQKERRGVAAAAH